MSEQTNKAPPSSPPRPGHRLARSITEVSPPALKLHHRTHHLHNHHHHHRTQSPAQPQINTQRAQSIDKAREREAQSAHPSSQPFLATGDTRWRDGVKSEMGTPAGSRRQSIWENGLDGTSLVVGGISGQTKVIKEGQVKAEREKGLVGAKELRNTLVTLHNHSNDASRRLDTTYYSVLEKLAILESSIASLKEVATLARAVNDDFAGESAELASEITTQLETFSNFSSQETRIQDLAQRVQAGRATIQGLGERVETVKRRVEGWERAEGEWQERTRRRLRVLWILVSLVAGIVVGLVVFRYTPARTSGHGVIKGLNVSELSRKIPGLDEEGNFTWSMQRKVEGEGVLQRLQKGQEDKEEAEDERLRVFDEL